MLQRLKLYLHTIRYLKIRQITGRIAFGVKRSWLRPAIIGWVNRQSVPNIVLSGPLVPKPQPESIHLCLPGRKRFVFQNDATDYERDIDWDDPGKPLLWRYHLHYFDYLIPLTGKPSAANYKCARDLLQAWIERNPAGSDPGWQPFPLSLRVVNWIFFATIFHKELNSDPGFWQALRTSLFRQAAFLSRFFEYHIQANHLIENCKALLYAGVFFGREEWVRRGWKELRREIVEQILTDGGHYERSPSYHSVVLCDLLDVLNLLRNSSGDIPGIDKQLAVEYLQKKAGAMLLWQQAMSHPDGSVALFGDSAFDTEIRVSELIDYAAKLGVEKSGKPGGSEQSLADSGYYIIKDGPHYLAVDGGPLGVRYQPGHAHGDLFSFEYSYRGRRFIVDSGVGEYLPTPRRSEARSTRAHNTLLVEGMEQMEAWGAFRAGRWIKSRDIGEVEFNNSRFSAEYQHRWSRGNHYRHRRTIELASNGILLITDEFQILPEKRAGSLLHLHPECRLTVSNGEVEVTRDNRTVWLLWNNRDIYLERKQGEYTPAFGCHLPVTVLHFYPQNGERIIRYGLVEAGLKEQLARELGSDSKDQGAIHDR